MSRRQQQGGSSHGGVGVGGGGVGGGSTHVPNLAELLGDDIGGGNSDNDNCNDGVADSTNGTDTTTASDIAGAASAKLPSTTTTTTSSSSSSSHNKIPAGSRSSTHVPNLAKMLHDDHDHHHHHDDDNDEFGHEIYDAAHNNNSSSGSSGNSSSKHNRPVKSSIVPNLQREEQWQTYTLEQVPESPTKTTASKKNQNPQMSMSLHSSIDKKHKSATTTSTSSNLSSSSSAHCKFSAAAAAAMVSSSSLHSSTSTRQQQVEARVQAVGLLFANDDDDDDDDPTASILVPPIPMSSDSLTQSGGEYYGPDEERLLSDHHHHHHNDFGKRNNISSHSHKTFASSASDSHYDCNSSVDHDDHHEDFNHHQSSAHIPESEDAVRERLRAAALVMDTTDGIDIDEEEQQQLKNREKEERDFYMSMSSSHTHDPTTQLSVSSSSTTTTEQLRSSSRLMMTNEQLKHKEQETLSSIKSKASFPTGSLSGSKYDQTDTKLVGEIIYSQELAVDKVNEKDVLAVKSLGSLHDQENPQSQCQGLKPPPMVVQPGALAVADGQAENRVKASLTEQPSIPPESEDVERQVMSNRQEVDVEGNVMVSSSVETKSPEQMIDVASSVATSSYNGVTSDLENNSPPACAAPVEQYKNHEEETDDLQKIDPAVNGKPNRRRRKWILVGLAILVVAVAAGIGGSLASSGSSNESPVTPTEEPSPTTAPTIIESTMFKSLKEVLAGNISSVEDLNTPGTPQYDALLWIADQDAVSNTNEMEKLTQRYILAVFYYALSGDEWKAEFQSSSSISSWLDPETDECSWEGVYCGTDRDENDCESDPNNVCEIRFEGENNMRGNVPLELQYLNVLKSLWLTEISGIAGLEGPLPLINQLSLDNTGVTVASLPVILKMTNLALLKLRGNDLASTVPTEIKNMKKLKVLDLSDTQLSGTIDDHFSQLSELQSLGLDRNNLRGKFEDLISGSTDIINLRILENSFSGTIPSSVANLQRLQRIEASGNSISGSIPNEIWSLPDFARLYLDNNRDLSGTFGDGIGNATNLQNLRVGDTRLEGTIPTSIGKLSKLNDLAIGPSFVSGPLPTEIGNLGKLRYLHIQKSFLSGTLPSSIGNLVRLEVWLMNDNNPGISGAIPSDVANLVSLKQWYLNGNPNLEGTIPAGVCELDSLEEIVVTGTELECTCPQCISQA